MAVFLLRLPEPSSGSVLQTRRDVCRGQSILPHWGEKKIPLLGDRSLEGISSKGPRRQSPQENVCSASFFTYLLVAAKFQKMWFFLFSTSLLQG
ncbi:MAG: hypothetical protein A2233_04200 [Candidatus Kerfeldbacteria bacterium RIFOXYA2_FULL_38_24]|uniref:Uncharacterized protein n=1 Tax=Candidatus Kerfeldbacteria bacterium RIFOXYB2_FULL_38_14 TaxID=1798547 RepID=A0A1G2BCQ3_9BACT|nr:MAG: hypothetical protein A2233_04200 [Candidatus Kerfeldbacteria bacterium RIFOXYA2_FULL_38_24]OGY86922.1 MAG: hypothetical protein A2319_00050 [Candidatus Kerfeldbacteria bacterium RIFOXYB2_FULL_38_14]OGY89927.1 MAG: hypothetical protein A2458_05045 [Candidatus Kerfeldbacteria bacterium RIFOXYC2_FULL_38_9]